MPQKQFITWLSSVVLGVGLAIASAGCGSAGSLNTVPVSGTITLNGQPLADASIYFMTDEFTGVGKTNAEGFYRLVQGARAGTNKVYITKVEGDAAGMLNPAEGMDMEQFRAAAAADVANPGKLPGGIQELVPTEYSDPQKSQLSVNVPPQGASGVDFHL